MPQVFFYRGRVVKRRQQADREPGKLLLICFPIVKGQPGERLTVTQSEWDRYHQTHFYNRDEMPSLADLRKAAENCL